MMRYRTIVLLCLLALPWGVQAQQRLGVTPPTYPWDLIKNRKSDCSGDIEGGKMCQSTDDGSVTIGDGTTANPVGVGGASEVDTLQTVVTRGRTVNSLTSMANGLREGDTVSQFFTWCDGAGECFHLLCPATATVVGDCFSTSFPAIDGPIEFLNTEFNACNALHETTGALTKSAAGSCASNIATTNGTETLTAKTLTSPTLTDPAVTGSLNIPNGAAPTTDAFGEIAGDNNAWATGRGAVQFYDGTANTYLVGTLASDPPTNGQVPTWNTGGTITWETPATTTQTESFFFGCEDADNANDDDYLGAGAGVTGCRNSEDAPSHMMFAYNVTLTAMSCIVATAPGVGDNLVITLRTAATPGAFGATAMTCTISGTNTTCSVSGQSIAITANATRFSIQHDVDTTTTNLGNLYCIVTATR